MLIRQETGFQPADLYCETLRSTCGSFDLQPAHRNKMIWGGVSVCERAGIETALVATDLHSAVRTCKNIRQDSGENYFLIIQQYGRALMAQGDCTAMLLPGDMMFVDSSKPSEFRFQGERSMQISLHVPRTSLIDYFGREVDGGLTLSRDDPTAKALHAVLEKLLRQDETLSSNSYLQDALFGLLGVFLFEDSRQKSCSKSFDLGSEAVLLGNVLEFVESRFRDPDFAVNEIATAHRVSARQVQRAFENLGMTPTKFVLTKRLDYAKTLIEKRDGLGRSARISTIAYDSGFSDISYFNRRFKEFYGRSPRELQAADNR